MDDLVREWMFRKNIDFVYIIERFMPGEHRADELYTFVFCKGHRGETLKRVYRGMAFVCMQKCTLPEGGNHHRALNNVKRTATRYIKK